jgi:hypothetical protein
MRRTTVVASVLAGLGLAGVAVGPVAAQSRVVVVPIITQPQRAAPPTSAGRQSVQVTSTPTSAGRQSVQVTTTTVSPQPGVTTTRITVQDTTGRLLGVSPPRTAAPQPGVTTTRITVQDTTGRLLGVSPPPRMTVGADPGGQRQATVGDGPTLVVPVLVTLPAASGGGHQTVTITTDGPIDVPIVILTE